MRGYVPAHQIAAVRERPEKGEPLDINIRRHAHLLHLHA